MALTPAMIVDALDAIGRPATAPEIRDKLLDMFPNVPMGRTPLQSVRARLQENCSQSGQYKRRGDLFRRVTPVEARQGVWELRRIQPPALGDGEEENGPEWFIDEAEVGMTEEGRQRLRTHLHRERSTGLVQRFKAALDTYICQVCDFDFEKTYGEIGARLEDLVAICSNCHRMIHRNGLLDWRQLRRIVRPGEPD